MSGPTKQQRARSDRRRKRIAKREHEDMQVLAESTALNPDMQGHWLGVRATHVMSKVGPRTRMFVLCATGLVALYAIVSSVLAAMQAG